MTIFAKILNGEIPADVVYEDEDVYRGRAPRHAILLNHEDMRGWDIAHGDRIQVTTTAGSMMAVAHAFDIVRGGAAMYFPECNVLVPRTIDPASKTPAFKGFVATLGS